MYTSIKIAQLMFLYSILVTVSQVCFCSQQTIQNWHLRSMKEYNTTRNDSNFVDLGTAHFTVVLETCYIIKQFITIQKKLPKRGLDYD